MELVSLNPLWWLIGLVPLIFVVRYGLVDRPKTLKRVALGLRIGAILLLITAVCRPFWGYPSNAIHVVFVLDVSESVDLAEARNAIKVIEDGITALGPSDSWDLFLVADGLLPMATPEQATAKLTQWLESLPDNDFRRASKLADAISSVKMCFPARKAKRVVLLTDGRPTETPMNDALVSLEQDQIDLRLYDIPGLKTAEACIESLVPSTDTAFEGEIVQMTAKVTANQAMPATLRLFNKAVVVYEHPLRLDPDRGHTVHVEVPMTTSGATHWTAELVADQDHFLINNKATCTVTVKGKPRLLILHETPRSMRHFVKAMTEQDLEIDLRSQHGMPDTLASLLAFDAVILANIAATDLSSDQMAMLKRYVIDFGGGLAMFGSNNSFGLGGYYRTAIEEVLPLTSRYEKEKKTPSVAMVLVIDKSGSMRGMPIELARQAAKSTVDLLSKQDQIGVVAFDGQAFVVSPLRPVTQGNLVKNAINTLGSGGGTFMYPGIENAYQMLNATVASIKHVIVLSDGQSQDADHEGLVKQMAMNGITVSTIALGNANRNLLALLAQIGQGRYYETNDPANIPKIFTKETIKTSGTAIKEDLFNLVQTSDHPLLSGFNDTDLPVVLGYVMTRVKPATQLLLIANSGDPIMAVSRYGLGTGLAYTSDVTDTWGAQWLTWNQFGRFWSQTIRGIVRRDKSDGLSFQQSHTSREWTVNISCQDNASQPLTDIDFDAQVVDNTETVTPVSVKETGLGTYQVIIPLAQAKTLALRLHDRDHDKLATLHFNKPYPEEYNLSRPIESCLSTVPRLTPHAIKENALPVKTRIPVSHIFYLLALICMVAGLLLRRI